MKHIEWSKPSPGTWESDRSHQARPFGRFMDDAILEPTKTGFAEGFARAGIPLQTIEPAIINGWYYMCVRPLGGPPEAKGAPPKPVMRLMFALHPELRRRHRRAAAFFEERVWEREIDEWFARDRHPFVDTLMSLAATDQRSLDTRALTDHMSAAAKVLRELTLWHFRGVPAGAIPIGDYLVHSEAWGIEPVEAIDAIAGFTAATTEPLANLDRVVDALRDDGALELLEGQSAHQVLDALRSHRGRVSAEIATYQLIYGPRVTTDFTVFGETLNELPEVIVQSLRQRATGTGRVGSPRDAAVAAENELRQRIPESNRAEWDSMLAAARRGFERREDEGDLMLRAAGIARLALLELGRRLVEDGRLDEAETTLDLTESEVVAIIDGGGPTREAAAEYTAQRRRFTTLEPPARIGPESAPPPIDIFPPAVARIVAAMFAFVSRFNPDGDPIPEDGLAGHGVSRGLIEGRATVVRDASDFARFGAGDILIAPMTTPAFNVLLAAASGLVTETGGLISHAAVVSREFGIPGVVGVSDALTSIPDGALIRVNGDEGTVTILDADPNLETQQTVAKHEAAIAATIPDQPGEIAQLADVEDSSRFGGKAVGLARLIRNGLAVPPGVALDVDFVQAIAAGDPVSHERLTAALDDIDGPFAVRSSATVEDSGEASFAGQFATLLDVQDGDAAMAAVRDVWYSGSSAGVEAYRRRLGLDAPIRMAVVVQQLVDADIAGVLFFDPKTSEQIVEASWGLGETVVDGTLTPDRYRIDVHGRELSVDVGDKRVELVRSNGVVSRRDVAPERAARRCLDEDQLAALARLGDRVSSAFGDARDIEWAIVDGDVFCLQARPITRLVT